MVTVWPSCLPISAIVVIGDDIVDLVRLQQPQGLTVVEHLSPHG